MVKQNQLDELFTRLDIPAHLQVRKVLNTLCTLLPTWDGCLWNILGNIADHTGKSVNTVYNSITNAIKNGLEKNPGAWADFFGDSFDWNYAPTCKQFVFRLYRYMME